MDTSSNTKSNREGLPEKDIEIRITRTIRGSGLLAFISPEELQSFIALLTFVDESGRCELSSRRLGQTLNLSEKQAQKRLKKLCGIRWHGKPLVIKENGRERGRFTPAGYQVVEVEGLRTIRSDESEAGATDGDGSSEDGSHDGMRKHIHTNDGGPHAESGRREADTTWRPAGTTRVTKQSSSSGTPAGDMDGEALDNRPAMGNNCVVVEDINKKHTTENEGDRDVPVDQGETERILTILLDAGVSRTTASDMMKEYPLERIANQVRMLQFRNAKEPAAMLVKAIREDWAAPAAYMAKKRQETARKAKMEGEAREAETRRIWQRRIDEAKAKLSANELQKITRTAREKVQRELNGVLHGSAPESLVKAAVNRVITNQYLKRDSN